MRRNAGVTVIEMMITGVVMSIILVGILGAFSGIAQTNAMVNNLPPVHSDAMEIVNKVAAEVRKAPLCTATSGCTTDSAIHTANANSLTIYRDAAGSQRTFRLNNGTFEILNATTVVWSSPNVTSLTFQYLTNSGLTYNMTSSFDASSWGTTVSSTNLKGMTAIRITATTVRNGMTASYTSTVRLRNSPKKTSATG
ncbi:MAG: prepilin-type N-terminal cleavage/methylation domain-containing protein [Fimbriimonadaceae bacterium]|nr:prepilin-type N-terminal cleavage/methylation domain-containing protein [Fimbriimonadaceae bacterium]